MTLCSPWIFAAEADTLRPPHRCGPPPKGDMSGLRAPGRLNRRGPSCAGSPGQLLCLCCCCRLPARLSVEQGLALLALSVMIGVWCAGGVLPAPPPIRPSRRPFRGCGGLDCRAPPASIEVIEAGWLGIAPTARVDERRMWCALAAALARSVKNWLMRLSRSSTDSILLPAGARAGRDRWARRGSQAISGLAGFAWAMAGGGALNRCALSGPCGACSASCPCGGPPPSDRTVGEGPRATRRHPMTESHG
jgi:hypothetical protein